MSGVVAWFTGLPASGKTMLAARVREKTFAILLDGDELREILDADRYTRAARDTFYKRLAVLAGVLARQGHVVLVAATAPRRAHRELARTLAPRFLEIHVATPLAECERRDPKRLYARARAGGAPDLPGVGVPYEPPLAADVVASGGHDDTAVETIVRLLEQ